MLKTIRLTFFVVVQFAVVAGVHNLIAQETDVQQEGEVQQDTEAEVVDEASSSDEATASDNKNVEYEQLKVLEPLVGDWMGKGNNEEFGMVYEFKFNLRWSANKKMLIGEGQVRASADGNLEDKEFQPGWRNYFVWDHKDERIMDHGFSIGGPEEGVQQTTVWSVEKEGVYTIRQESSSAKDTRRPPESLTMVVSNDTATIITIGARNEKGERLPTQAMTMKKVN